MNERDPSGTVKLQGSEVRKVEELKYLGSIVWINGGKEVKACASMLEWAEKSAGCLTG